MLTQSEADALINLPKIRKSNDHYDFPLLGEVLEIPIISQNEQENFLIDVNRRKIRLTKCTYQERYQKTIPLIRLDVDGSPHPNPDVANVPLPRLTPYNGQTIAGPHLHLYVEGFMDKWAIPASNDIFPNTSDLYKTLHDFFRYCNIVETPKIDRRTIISEF